MANVQAGPSKGGNEFIDVDQALGFEMEPLSAKYDERDVSLYALGVGAAHSAPTDPSELGLVYEMAGGGFHPLPTMTAAITVQQIMKAAMSGKLPPGLNYGLDRILHGEHRTEMVRPLPPHAKLTHKWKVTAIYDKGKSAVVLNEIKSFDEDGELLAINEVTTFIRGAGGWGGESGPKTEVPIPDRAPDATIEEKTSVDQALLYRSRATSTAARRSDVREELRLRQADPARALHVRLRWAARHQGVREERSALPQVDRVRFVDPVIPGETLVTEMWKDGQRVVFRTKVKERDKVVLSNALVELHAELPKKVEKPKAAAAAGAPAGGGEPISADIFGGITAFFEKNKDVATKAQTIFLFKLTSPDTAWTLDTKTGVVSKGEVGKAECTLELSDADFMAMVSGKADAMKLFTSGKLKITGNIMASQKLDFLQKVDKADVAKAMARVRWRTERRRSGSSGGGGWRADERGHLHRDRRVLRAEQGHRDEGAGDLPVQPEEPDASYTLDTKVGSVAKGESARQSARSSSLTPTSWTWSPARPIR